MEVGQGGGGGAQTFPLPHVVTKEERSPRLQLALRPGIIRRGYCPARARVCSGHRVFHHNLHT